MLDTFSERPYVPELGYHNDSDLGICLNKCLSYLCNDIEYYKVLSRFI